LASGDCQTADDSERASQSQAQEIAATDLPPAANCLVAAGDGSATERLAPDDLLVKVFAGLQGLHRAVGMERPPDLDFDTAPEVDNRAAAESQVFALVAAARVAEQIFVFAAVALAALLCPAPVWEPHISGKLWRWPS
jgi:hypothetical protein